MLHMYLACCLGIRCLRNNREAAETGGGRFPRGSIDDIGVSLSLCWNDCCARIRC